jgi:hypothetical protein
MNEAKRAAIETAIKQVTVHVKYVSENQDEIKSKYY